ncbi:unnamed protein product [Citrullus colocynthis]|uniref:Cystatin domain-containing protein n=1 Tax=Citrullus colocynthis TaxID=252529 RepID=A0ABP0Y778_9ROSI
MSSVSLKPIKDIDDESVQEVGRKAVEHYNESKVNKNHVKFKRVVSGLRGSGLSPTVEQSYELVVVVEEDECNSSYVAKVNVLILAINFPPTYNVIAFEPILEYKK